MELRALSFDDIEAMWTINEQGLPGTGQVSRQELRDLLTLSILPIGAFQEKEMLGFVICLPPRTTYGSLNYAWFNERFDSFIYVDRIAVSETHRNKGVGTMLYERVVAYSHENNIPIAAEVNVEPPNPGSMRFHHRFGFEEVGTLQHKQKSVTMLLRKRTL
ncbi:MAG: Uncharacterised protein [Candidatus Poseidoniaceae archaeon]|nr:MAG: Uncharacterised protein [Candidatus Poseidoniaceae archaeon]